MQKGEAGEWRVRVPVPSQRCDASRNASLTVTCNNNAKYMKLRLLFRFYNADTMRRYVGNYI